MFFLALATDYDGTLALNGHVNEPTCKALEEIRRSGRRTILVTGRELPDLKSVFPRLDLFDLVVAENGGLLFDTGKQREIPLAPPPPPALVACLQRAGVEPLSVGRTIIATWEPHEALVLQAIRDLGLEQQIIFNKGAVMVLPSGVNKATGLAEALQRLRLSVHNAVGIGDAENDLAFLATCGCAFAVANALPSVKERADYLVADHGAGVIELINMLLRDDLRSISPRVPRHRPGLGTLKNGAPRSLTPFETVLVTGASGAGKSTMITALLEDIQALGYQFCVVDPEGDYSELRDTVIVGDATQPPRIGAAIDLLERPETSISINLLALDPNERPSFTAMLLPELMKLRAATGRPHWIVLEEAHHCLPAGWQPAPAALPRELPATIAITVHPEAVAADFLALVSTVVGVGEGAEVAIEKFLDARGQTIGDIATVRHGEALVIEEYGTAHLITAARPKEKQRRHIRKYAEGQLGEDKSFYFRGPNDELNLRAQNLSLFVQIAAGVDDATWLHHLRKGDYSRWFRESIKDEELSAEAKAIEAKKSLSAADSRARIKEIIEKRYTAPAKDK